MGSLEIQVQAGCVIREQITVGPIASPNLVSVSPIVPYLPRDPRFALLKHILMLVAVRLTTSGKFTLSYCVPWYRTVCKRTVQSRLGSSEKPCIHRTRKVPVSHVACLYIRPTTVPGNGGICDVGGCNGGYSAITVYSFSGEYQI